LEFHIGTLAPSYDTAVAVTCNDGRHATLAGATLTGLGYQTVTVLEGGMTAWQHAALPAEHGLAGVMSSPTDVVLSGPERNFADMMHYLRWEEELGTKYSS
jgi:3-mercaptopyruvate sulfurtransferase SseA